MKKKLLVIVGVILAVLLLCTLLVPRIILLGVTQEGAYRKDDDRDKHNV
jgi:hypothetical protein